MLCDDILAAADAPTTDPVGIAYRRGFEDLRGRIRAAVRYALERDVVEAAVAHSVTRPTNILKVLSFVRPPHPLTWIEWADADKTDAIDVLGFARDMSKPSPVRVGCLFTALNPISDFYTAEFAWRFADGSVHYAPMMLVFRVTEPFEHLDGEFLLKEAQRNAASPYCAYHAYRNHPRELEAVVEASRHWMPVPATCAEAFRTFVASAANGKDALDQIDASALGDLGSEIMFTVAVLLLMNTANGTRRTTEDRTRLNRARQKRGQPPLLGFSTVRMRLSRAEAAYAESMGAGGKRARHICRGHAKLRKRSDGTARLFWWSDHWRGRGPGLRMAPPIRTVRV